MTGPTAVGPVGSGGDGELSARWSGQERSFPVGARVRIGREPGSEIECSNAAVSRSHAIAEHLDGRWQVRDLGSSRGTWHHGRRVDTVEIRGTVQLSLGEEGQGEVLVLESSTVPASPDGSRAGGRGAPTDLATPIVRGAGTVIVGDGGGDAGTVVGGSPRPGGPLRHGLDLEGTVVPDRSITVTWEGRTESFAPGAHVTIGRGPENAVAVDRPMVSRSHARLVFEGSGWHLEDTQSRGGTYLGGKAVVREPITGATTVHLGDPASAAVVTVLPAGAPPVGVGAAGGPGAKDRSRPPRVLLAGIAALVVLVLVLVSIVVVVGRDGGGGSVSTATLTRATVRIVNGNVSGSGTVIDADEGLILTNAHVAAPRSPGGAVRQLKFDVELPEPQDELIIETADGIDAPVEPRFRGEVVAVDGYLDLAIVRIVRTVGGRLVEAGDDELTALTEVELGDSDDLTTGSRIRVFGFPGAANSRSVTLTEGVVSAAVQDERIGHDRAMLNYSAGTLPGNSGGGVYDEAGRLVGVPTLLWEGKVASMRPVNFVADLLESVRSGEEHQSPYVRPVVDEKVEVRGLAAGGPSAGTSFACDGAPLGGKEPTVGVQLGYSGFEPGRHQDLLVRLSLGDEELGRWALGSEHPVAFPGSSGCLTVDVPVTWPERIGEDARFSVTVGLGPEHATD